MEQLKKKKEDVREGVSGVTLSKQALTEQRGGWGECNSFFYSEQFGSSLPMWSELNNASVD